VLESFRGPAFNQGVVGKSLVIQGDYNLVTLSGGKGSHGVCEVLRNGFTQVCLAYRRRSRFGSGQTREN
jgi:hypothetical protein